MHIILYRRHLPEVPLAGHKILQFDHISFRSSSKGSEIIHQVSFQFVWSLSIWKWSDITSEMKHFFDSSWLTNLWGVRGDYFWWPLGSSKGCGVMNTSGLEKHHGLTSLKNVFLDVNFWNKLGDASSCSSLWFKRVDLSFCFAFNRSHITIDWCLLWHSFIAKPSWTYSMYWYTINYCHVFRFRHVIDAEFPGRCQSMTVQKTEFWVDIGRQLLPPEADVKYNSLAKNHFQWFWFSRLDLLQCIICSLVVSVVTQAHHAFAQIHMHGVGSIFETSCCPAHIF